VAHYEFLTVWRLDAPREDVWDAIWESERWPEWWRGVEEAVELDPGTPCGIGRRGRYRWRSRIPYSLSFEAVATEVERPSLLAGEAFGDLVGRGVWRLAEDAGLSTVTYEWDVRTAKRWMNLTAPVARPLFRWNHDRIMSWGGEGLARHLGARLLPGT